MLIKDSLIFYCCGSYMFHFVKSQKAFSVFFLSLISFFPEISYAAAPAERIAPARRPAPISPVIENVRSELKDVVDHPEHFAEFSRDFSSTMSGERYAVSKTLITAEEFSIVKMGIYAFVRNADAERYEHLFAQYRETRSPQAKAHLKAFITLVYAIKSFLTSPQQTDGEIARQVSGELSVESRDFTQGYVAQTLERFQNLSKNGLFLGRKIFERRQQTRGALLATQDISRNYEPGGLINLTPENAPEFYAVGADNDMGRVASLLRQFQLVPGYCFGDAGAINPDFLKIESLPRHQIQGNNTESIYFVKVKHRESPDFKTVYVVKSPSAVERTKEVSGLIAARELLSHLPMPQKRNAKGFIDWPELKFHEAIFNYQAREQQKSLIFLHGASGKPWGDYLLTDVREFLVTHTRGSALIHNQKEGLDQQGQDKLDEVLDEAYQMGRQIGLVERRFLRGDWNHPETLYTLSFMDPHGANIFYDKERKKFSWIDLSTMGASARAYFDPESPLDFDPQNLFNGSKTKMGWGLNFLLMYTVSFEGSFYTRTGGLRKMAFNKVIEGYFSVFDDLPRGKRLTIRQLILDLSYARAAVTGENYRRNQLGDPNFQLTDLPVE